jgi:hypothetical protein
MTPLPWHHEIAVTIALAFITALVTRALPGRFVLWLRLPLFFVAMWALQAINHMLPPDWVNTNESVVFRYWWSFPWYSTQAAIYFALIVQAFFAMSSLMEGRKS